MKIIAFSGKRTSGKSTMADHLVERYHAVKVSFADQLREELLSLGYPRHLVYGKPTTTEMRALMIAHGQARRAIDPDYWVKKVIGRLAQPTVYGSGLVVIDDLRFWNEADKLKFHRAVLVRVTRMDPPAFEAGVDDDPSETDLDEWGAWDFEVSASGGQVAHLKEAARSIVGCSCVGVRS
jgi:phosphomevalonate kinase